MEQENNKAIASMVLGIISLPTSFIPFVGLVLGILAVYYFKQADRLIKSNPKVGGRGMAIAGLVTGIIGIVMGALYLVFWIFYATLIATLLSAGTY
ncbi:MAG TPA: DUF4190 domain-containing protein [Candidatus Nanoarchaeia archaeon]|nr:DUF4190 domain-containing protein [Candidatus Nanoarchaeia archaeon]